MLDYKELFEREHQLYLTQKRQSDQLWDQRDKLNKVIEELDLNLRGYLSERQKKMLLLNPPWHKTRPLFNDDGYWVDADGSIITEQTKNIFGQFFVFELTDRLSTAPSKKSYYERFFDICWDFLEEYKATSAEEYYPELMDPK